MTHMRPVIMTYEFVIIAYLDNVTCDVIYQYRI